MCNQNANTLEDKIIELRAMELELDEAVYFDDAVYVIERLHEKVSDIKSEIQALEKDYD